MRRPVATAAAGVLFAGLLGYLLYSGWGDGFEADTPVVVNVDPGRVQAIRVERRGAAPLEVRREGDRWQLVAPGRLPTSDAEVEKLLRRLSPLRAERVVAQSPPARAEEYGLQVPGARVVVTLADGTRRELEIGDLSPLQESIGTYYVRNAANARIYTVSRVLVEGLVVGPEQLRERRLVAVEAERVQRVVLRRGRVRAGSIVAQRTGDWAVPEERRWRLVEPVAAPADARRIEQALRDLQFSWAQAFVNDRPGERELAAYGLQPPLLEVELYYTPEPAPVAPSSVRQASASELARVAVRVGRAFSEATAAGDGTEGFGGKRLRYVQVGDAPFVYGFEGADLEGLLKASLAAWVRQRVVGLPRSELKHLRIELPGRAGPVTLREEKGGWRLQVPGQPPRRLSFEAVSPFIGALWDLSARSVEAVGKDLEALRREGRWGRIVLTVSVEGLQDVPETRLVVGLRSASRAPGTSVGRAADVGPAATGIGPVATGAGPATTGVGSATPREPATLLAYVEQGSDRLLYAVDASAVQKMVAAAADWLSITAREPSPGRPNRGPARLDRHVVY